MAFDETGQATSADQKFQIATRAFNILTDLGFPPDDIIFDLNVLTIATGIEEHNEYALSFIDGVSKVKQAFPGVRTSGGISNISFSFRGNNPVREADAFCVLIPRDSSRPGYGYRKRGDA